MTKTNNYIRYSQLSPVQQRLYYDLIYRFVKRLEWEYPNFRQWYKALYNENQELKRDREIIFCEREFQIVALAILKKTDEERKICTLRVAKPYQRQGIGKSLMEQSFKWLEDDKPLITVHKYKNNEFVSLFKYYDFKLEQKQRNYYSIFSTELAYNGILPEKKLYFNSIELSDIQDFYKKFMESHTYDMDAFVEACVKQWQQREKIRRIVMS